ncbi:transposase IS66 family protein [Roseomonas sp. TAS13]|uniref:IS66 family transposase n=1 Tax=Roseomonas sp. TAS13 TaxID=1926319 RepID=UPI00095B216E|nr:IS66 family transposase [Roseomonas sp. TAS13]USQ70025.1 IS66 family transposase [Roseomonas mucosa]USQ73795.1 IS66 family transposase [Roseomonas mucosa]GAV33880.1 transposase IS66 family protein [Roseomonas sp. TAS13]
MRAADTETADFPDDPAALRALLAAALSRCDALEAERDGIAAERDALAERNERLRHLLEKLRRMQFGKRSERLPEDQLHFAFEELEASIAEAAAEVAKTSPEQREGTIRRRRAGRGRLPAHLPRVEVVLAPETMTCPCCDGALVEIGTDTSERLDVIPARFQVLVTRRPKFACRACPGTVLQASAPPRLVEGGVPTEATVAHVLVSRYADHLPLYRQSQILLRQGIEIGREVLADWTGTAAHEVLPVVRRMHEILLTSPKLFADETTMPVLDPGRGQTKKGYAWALARDDRPWGGTDPPAVVFHYAPGRGAEHGRALLRNYGGILQCDGYGVYKAIAAERSMTLAFCWSHVRREFIPLAKGKTAPIAAEALRRIAALYAVEAEVRGSLPEVRQSARQARSRPLVEELFAWLREALARLPGSSPTAEAIRYALNHQDGLVRFLDDGRIEMDSNTVERAIRPLCLSRKNALFASGDDGGARWAAVASLVETCKLNGVDPQRYLADLLTRLVGGWPNSRLDELMPWCWAATASG